MAELLLSIGQVAKQFSCSAQTIRRWTALGGFPRPIRPPGGHLIRWRQSDLDSFVAELPPSELGTNKSKDEGHNYGDFNTHAAASLS